MNNQWMDGMEGGTRRNKPRRLMRYLEANPVLPKTVEV